MNAPVNHWKLGLFVVVGGLLGLGAVVVLASLSMSEDTVTYTSYFDESVTGLELDSPVKFRGVTIGTVSAIEVAPDRRHVEVSYDLEVLVLARLGIAAGKGSETRLRVPVDLRAQLGSTGLSGLKYILMDFFDSKTHPAPVLGFAVPENYIPGEPSTMKNLEDSVVRAVDQFPVLAEEILRVLGQVNTILADIQDQGVAERAVTTLGNVDDTLLLVQAKLRPIDTAALSADARQLIAQLDQAAVRAQAALVSIQHASDAVGGVADNARGVGPDLAQALRDVSEAAVSLRELLQALELEPDMLVKGRSVSQ